jgi:hypothetical protein
MSEFGRIFGQGIGFGSILITSSAVSSSFHQHCTLREGKLYKMVSARQSNPLLPCLSLFGYAISLRFTRGNLDR